MEGFVLAAGLGTRLRPLTDDKPKALVDIEGVTLLEIAIRRLEEGGIKHIVVNVHHFADKVVDFIGSHTWQARIDISDESALLLNTGGALKHAAPLFSGSEPVLVHNVDILSEIDFHALEQHHLESGNLVTLCTSHRETNRMILFDGTGNLAGIYGQDDAPGLTPLPFSGVSMVSPELFPLMPPDDHPYPVFGAYLKIAKDHKIGYFMHSDYHWLDVGKPETLELARQWRRS